MATDTIKRHNFYLKIGNDGRTRVTDKRFRRLAFSDEVVREDATLYRRRLHQPTSATWKFKEP